MNDNKAILEILSFIVFDPTLSDDENEEERKILYHHPRTIPIRQLTTTIGLCEAMCNFAREFTDSPCQYIHTMKTRMVFHKMENNIFMILSLKIPQVSEANPAKPSTPDHKQIEPDNYLDEEIQNSICESIISHCRQMFFLCMGPPSLIIKNANIESLKEKLIAFFDTYISKGMFDNYQIIDGLTGVQYLVVDKEVCANADVIIQRIQAKFPIISSSMLLFNNNVISTTVDKEDLGILYRYLTTTILTKYNIEESINSFITWKSMGRSLAVSLITNISNLPKVFFGTASYLRGNYSAIKECRVIVYKALQTNFVFFVDERVIIDRRLCDSIHESIGSTLPEFSQLLNKKYGEISLNTTNSPFRYVYWNPDTLSVKCTLFPNGQLQSYSVPQIPLDIIRLMCDIREELDRNKQLREMTVKLDSDSWVSSLKENRRELLVAINKRNFSLVDVSKEMKQICNRHFPDIFRFDC